jgi:hypothetical protein
VRRAAAASEPQALIWLSSVKSAHLSRPIVMSSSEPALSVLFVLQVRLVGGTAF